MVNFIFFVPYGVGLVSFIPEDGEGYSLGNVVYLQYFIFKF